MAEPTPFALSRHLSLLIGRKVTFVQATSALDSKLKQIYGIYNVLPHETAVVVKADLQVLGAIAGALVGLPAPVVKEHLAAATMDELMRDAIYEVLNVASAAVSTEGRAVFIKMVTDPAYIDGAAEQALKNPAHRSYFNVSVEDYLGGRICIFSQFVPAGVARS